MKTLREQIEKEITSSLPHLIRENGEYKRAVDQILAVVEEKVMGAVPEEHGTTAPECNRRAKGQKCESCAEVEGWNRCRNFTLQTIHSLFKENITK